MSDLREGVRVTRRGEPDGAHLLTAFMLLEQPLDQVFRFFSDAENLGRITPPELGFRILSDRPIQMEEGRLIEYRLGFFGFPLRWHTLIARWNPPHEFVDRQLRGPYREWVHTHRFRQEVDGTSRIEDVVRFRLPLHPVGELGFPIIRRQLRRIFRHRQTRIRDLLTRGS